MVETYLCLTTGTLHNTILLANAINVYTIIFNVKTIYNKLIVIEAIKLLIQQIDFSYCCTILTFLLLYYCITNE